MSCSILNFVIPYHILVLIALHFVILDIHLTLISVIFAHLHLSFFIYIVFLNYDLISLFALPCFGDENTYWINLLNPTLSFKFLVAFLIFLWRSVCLWSFSIVIWYSWFHIAVVIICATDMNLALCCFVAIILSFTLIWCQSIYAGNLFPPIFGWTV